MNYKLLNVIVPVYNEQDSINEFVQKISAVQLIRNHIDNPYDWQTTITFVNDGSKDKSKDVIMALIQNPKQFANINIHYIELSRNFGKESAMWAGLTNVSDKPDAISLADIDLQDPIEEIYSYADDVIAKKFDAIVAYRNTRPNESKLRKTLTHWFYKLINKLSDVPIKENVRDFRVMNPDVLTAILSVTEKNRFSKGIFSWVGFNVDYRGYNSQPRQHGNSKFSIFSLMNYATDGIIGFSKKPLHVIYVTSLSLLAISFVGILAIITQKFTGHHAIDGWTSIMTLILFLSAIQIGILGIIGEYIGQIFTETKNRPNVIIKEKILGDPNAKKN